MKAEQDLESDKNSAKFSVVTCFFAPDWPYSKHKQQSLDSVNDKNAVFWSLASSVHGGLCIQFISLNPTCKFEMNL